MQRIERYGVIALVFLLVTILAVAVWGQRKNQSLLSMLKRDKPTDTAALDTQPVLPAPVLPGLGLSSPSHEVSQAPAQPLNYEPVTAPSTGLIAPAGPGSDAVSFDHGNVLTPNGAPGFITGGTQIPSPPLVLTPSLPEGGARTYTVKSGDTLGSIAQRELGSTKRWKEIESLNGVRSERLSIGMVLKLPTSTSSGTTQTLVRADPPVRTQPVVSNPNPSSTRTYTIRSGDSLSRIAATQMGDANRYGEILAMNPGLNPAKLGVGQVLRMPQEAKPQSVATRPSSRPAPAKSGNSEVARAEPAPKKARVQ